MDAAAISAVGINDSGQGRVNYWMTQALSCSVRADVDGHRYQNWSPENEGRTAAGQLE